MAYVYIVYKWLINGGVIRSPLTTWDDPPSSWQSSPTQTSTAGTPILGFKISVFGSGDLIVINKWNYNPYKWPKINGQLTGTITPVSGVKIAEAHLGSMIIQCTAANNQGIDVE